MSETTPEEFKAECPHLACQREELHEGHGWRGTSREFGGAVEATRTYWCPGSVPETSQDARTTPDPARQPHQTPSRSQEDA